MDSEPTYTVIDLDGCEHEMTAANCRDVIKNLGWHFKNPHGALGAIKAHTRLSSWANGNVPTGFEHLHNGHRPIPENDRGVRRRLRKPLSAAEQAARNALARA